MLLNLTYKTQIHTLKHIAFVTRNCHKVHRYNFPLEFITFNLGQFITSLFISFPTPGHIRIVNELFTLKISKIWKILNVLYVHNDVFRMMRKNGK